MTACLPCALETTDAAASVFRDDVWACEVADGYDVPGWFVLRLRRHAEGWSELSSDEAAGFGVVAQRLDAAVREATGAVGTYLMSFGENHKHFHFLAIARPADLAPALRGAAVLGLRGDHRDAAASLSVAAAVRDAYAALPTT